MATILSWKLITAPSSSNLSRLKDASDSSNGDNVLFTNSQVYERPLGLTELNFYWDSVFTRSTDLVQSAEVEVVKGSGNPFTIDNILKTWTSMKQQFPLLAARIEQRGPEVFFVVDKDRLNLTRSTEVIFQTTTSSEDVKAFLHGLVDAPKHLSNDKISQPFVLSETNRLNFYHILFHVAHCITGGIGSLSFLRIFLDRLSSTDPSPVWDIKRQLALSASSEELLPQKKISMARQRWHRAIGHALHTINTNRFLGGHTLPGKITKNTSITPSLPRKVATSFSEEQLAPIIRCCRAHGLTFGQAYSILGQVAMTRVLCRRKQPMIISGPLSLRPLLNQDWFNEGGAFNMNLAIAFFHYTLPFMPLGSAAALAPGDPLPSVEQLLSPARFFLRCNMIKQQSIKYMTNPYFFERFRAAMLAGVLYREARVENWHEHNLRLENDGDEGAFSAIQRAQMGHVFSHGGSSIGNIDNLVPFEYPLKRKKNAPPILCLYALSNRLRCVPGELYLGAYTYRKKLFLFFDADGNVFEDEVISEWLDEVKNATLFYLGQGTLSPAHL